MRPTLARSPGHLARARPRPARPQVRPRRPGVQNAPVGPSRACPPSDNRRRSRERMTEVHHGLEGVVAFETEIAEPDKEGSALRYRGVDSEDIVGRVPFENIWGLLIDGC